MKTNTGCMGAGRARFENNAFRRAGYWFASWMARRAAGVALSSLDDYMLKDMGLSRNAIRSAMDSQGRSYRPANCCQRRY
jgi:uncharacterized protein YjiS (DUF1127 family)